MILLSNQFRMKTIRNRFLPNWVILFPANPIKSHILIILFKSILPNDNLDVTEWKYISKYIIIAIIHIYI